MCNVHVHTNRVCLLCFVLFCCLFVLLDCFVVCLFCCLLCSVLICFVIVLARVCAHEYHITARMIYCCDITVQSIILTLVRLHDLQHLLILYPNKRKDEVFGKYYAPPRKRFCCVHGWMLPCSQVLEKGEGELVPMFTHTHTKSPCCNLHTIGFFTEIPQCV